MALHLDPTGKERLGDLAADVDATIQQLGDREAVRRIWEADYTLWQEDPTEVVDRLGWLHVIHELFHEVEALRSFTAACAADGLTDAVVMGMGGSSLFPEVLARSFPGDEHRHGHHPALGLHVLDTTDPATVRRLGQRLTLDHTLFVAASKSGTTVEVRSHLAHFWEATNGAGHQFVAITDRGTPLAALAAERGFRRVFEARTDIGGRYSALSHFGMVPGALAGVDIHGLLESALAMAEPLRQPDDPFEHPGLRLGALLGAAARRGIDKLTIICDPEIASFGLWLEQLIAESTGKQGAGVVPVVGEEVADPLEQEVYGRDRLFVSIGWHPALDALAGAGHPVVELPYEGRIGLGAHVLLWEFATAVCGIVLRVNPFDQPNVAEAKEETSRVLASGVVPTVALEPLDGLLASVRPGDYLALQAFVDPGSPVVGDLERVRAALRDRLLVATTLGLGPRFLHSTGQLHKGGPPTGVFVQVVGDDPDDVPIPGQPYGFSTLKQAQAAGDLETLRGKGLRAARVSLDELLGVTP
ncbi:MAG: glucose-6-phosphate isomerase [Acidimicrobiales bacterium]